MIYLSDAKIIDYIHLYLNRDIYNYAVLIDGEWGSGKTHFIKKTLIPALKERNPSLESCYVSLYGMKDVKEITDNILLQSIERKIGSGGKLPIKVSNFADIAIKLLGEKSGGVVDSDNLLSILFDYNNHYFIFDDLERCSIPINEVLGYINFFLEQNSSKVLLVANESEIGTIEHDTDNVLKYFVASQDSIDWKNKDDMDAILDAYKRINNPPKTSEKPDIHEIKRRSKVLIDENAFYLRIKEKLIGQTIFYRPNLYNVIPVIFNNCIDREWEHNKKDEYIEAVCNYMESNNCFNLRTLQFGLIFFSHTLDIFPMEGKCPKIYNALILNLLMEILKISINYKNGKEPYKWNKDGEYEFFVNHHTRIPYSISFKFVQDYVYYGSCDQGQVKNVLENCFIELKSSHEDLADPLNKLNEWYLLEDEEIKENLEAMIKKLLINNYDSSNYQIILIILFTLKGVGFEEVRIKDAFNYMKQQVAEGNSIVTMRRAELSDGNLYKNEYHAFIEELEKIERSSSVDSIENFINTIFDKGFGWGLEFDNFCGEKRTDFMDDNKFFKLINIEKCYSAINTGKPLDIRHFNMALRSVYSFNNLKDYYSEDLENIEKLYNLLQTEDSSNNLMEQHYKNYLKQLLESILERLR